MLIKYYTLAPTDRPSGSLHIIEGVSSVSVPQEVFSSGERPQDVVHDSATCYRLDNFGPEQQPNPFFKKIITFKENDGTYGYLEVFGKAYVCNDDGKTIEKVCPNNYIGNSDAQVQEAY